MFHNSREFFHKNKKGAALIIAIFMMIVFAFIGVTIGMIVSSQSLSSAEEMQSIQALYLAEMGAEIAVTNGIKSGSHSFTIDTNTVVITVTKIGEDLVSYPPLEIFQVESRGIIGDVSRKIVSKYKLEKL